jgi:hypothetical protein
MGRPRDNWKLENKKVIPNMFSMIPLKDPSEHFGDKISYTTQK